MEIKKATDIVEGTGTYLLYGAPGMGKTSSAKYFPGKTLVLDVDRTSNVLKGCPNIDIVEVSNLDTFGVWTKLIIELVADYKGVYDNIMVDNISELERCILSDLGRQGKNRGVPSQGDYQIMQFKILNSLRYMKEMNSRIIWTAWEDSELYTESSGQQFNRSYPRINKKVVDNVCGLCSVVARLIINTEGKRGFILEANNSTYAKNQLDGRKGCLQSELITGGDGGAATTVSVEAH